MSLPEFSMFVDERLILSMDNITTWLFWILELDLLSDLLLISANLAVGSPCGELGISTNESGRPPPRSLWTSSNSSTQQCPNTDRCQETAYHTS